MEDAQGSVDSPRSHTWGPHFINPGSAKGRLGLR